MKFYYINSERKSVGPFQYDEFKEMGITPDTLIWYTGLKQWTPYKETPLFVPSESLIGKPAVTAKEPLELKNKSLWFKTINYKKVFTYKYFIIGISAVIILAIILCLCLGGGCSSLRHIRAEAYEDAELNKDYELFLRDIEFFGIAPAQSKTVIVKLAPMQYFKDTKDYHGVSFGFNKDDMVEVYINEDSWKHFSRAQRLAVVYHELSHDILNVDDLPDTESNRMKLMCPVMDRFAQISMDDFIEMSHEFFLEVASKD